MHLAAKMAELEVLALAEVLPWLHPRGVASLACTCSSLAAAAASLTRSRLEDAARGLERWPVPILNEVDHVLYPYFSYSPISLFRSTLSLQRWWGGKEHVSHPSRVRSMCTSPHKADTCSCFLEEPCTESESVKKSCNNNDQGRVSPPSKKSRQENLQSPLCGRTLDGEPAYDSHSRLFCLTVSGSGEEDSSHDFLSIMECGPACGCSQSCKFRVTQHGLAVKVAVFRDHLKGWGLRAMQLICKGSYVFEYAGELLTTPEARSRQKEYDELRRKDKRFMHCLLIIREHLPSGRACLRLNIDATHVGNVARFVNHSCDGGNLLPCLARLNGCFIPKLVFFARRNIAEGEELTFSYGDIHDDVQEAYRCFCKTASCSGFLPFEET